MTTHNASIRRRQFKVADLTIRINQACMLLAEWELLSRHLELEIAQEEKRTQIFDRDDIAYSLYAKATLARRNNLQRSIGELRDKIEAMRSTLIEASSEVSRLQDVNELTVQIAS